MPDPQPTGAICKCGDPMFDGVKCPVCGWTANIMGPPAALFEQCETVEQKLAALQALSDAIDLSGLRIPAPDDPGPVHPATAARFKAGLAMDAEADRIAAENYARHGMIAPVEPSE